MLLVLRGTVGTMTLIVLLLLKAIVLADHPTLRYPSSRHGVSTIRHQCTTLPNNMTLCRGVGYRRVRLPNLFGHETLDEAREQAERWILLVNIHCHPDTQVSTQHITRGGPERSNHLRCRLY